MTLKIEISNINSSEAVDFVSACRKVQDDMNDDRTVRCGGEPNTYDLVGMQFEFKDEPQPIFRGETTAFERYINSTKN